MLTLAVPGSDAPGSPSDTGAVIRALTSLGAGYVYGELGAAFEYTGNWLRAARTLDPGGPVGELAFLVQLEAGFGEPLCNGPHAGEWFRAVIDEGERYLRAPHDRAYTARVHLLVADAYRDIVALANGAAGDYADPSRYRSEEPAARARAVEHYRAAITAEPGLGPGSRRAAWREAWRLLAGLAPADQLRFFCVYD